MNGICFIKPLFNAVVEGRKTQTRRVIDNKTLEKLEDYWSWYDFALAQRTHEVSVEPDKTESFARYKVGEILYLKEPYYDYGLGTILYKYSGDYVGDYEGAFESMVWENKLFMPEKYARYFIEITGVRCERLQDISDEDCEKEGIMKEADYPIYYVFGSRGIGYDTTKQAFSALINSIKKGIWEQNAYVWVYDFKLVEKPLL